MSAKPYSTRQEQELFVRWTHHPCIRSAADAKEDEEEAEEPRHGDYRPWSDIATPLLATLLPRLTLLDRVLLASVCRSWRQFFAEHPSRLPWLMVPHDISSSSDTRAFCSPWEKVYYTISLPCTSHMYCRAAAHGWLLFAANLHTSSKMFLFNPISKARIDLPPSPFLLLLAALSAPPTDPSCVVVAMGEPRERHPHQIYYCRVGDNTWQIQRFTFMVCSNVAVVDGKFYFLSGRELGEMDFSRSWPLRWLYLDDSELPHVDATVHNIDKRILVNSLGDLLIVTLAKPLKAYVHKCDFASMKWIKVEDLNDRSLFLSTGCCLSLPTADIGDSEGNVYVAEHYPSDQLQELRRNPYGALPLWQHYKICREPVKYVLRNIACTDNWRSIWFLPSIFHGK
ncbi:F-box/kelch-repeat protein [Canna indica]|uniref:F-box/kelch-repeat protein n=1 Tax=Canna indica TaxID=4628 RepID=A0AAQ3KDM8_9LILI|nr:F-box/kelch-repeat protein [Canna indica]